jgi:hypothetical protein
VQVLLVGGRRLRGVAEGAEDGWLRLCSAHGTVFIAAGQVLAVLPPADEAAPRAARSAVAADGAALRAAAHALIDGVEVADAAGRSGLPAALVRQIRQVLPVVTGERSDDELPPRQRELVSRLREALAGR